MGPIIQPVQLVGELQVNERSCLKGMDGSPEDDTQGYPLTSTCTHMHPHIKIRVRTKKKYKVPGLVYLYFFVADFVLGLAGHEFFICLCIFIVKHKYLSWRESCGKAA